MKVIVAIAGHDYGHHCQRTQSIPGTTAGHTRYEEICTRRIESFCTSPDEFNYDLEGEKEITAYVMRFTETDSDKEKSGRQIVTQTFKVAKDTTVPPLFDDSWKPFKGTEKLVGFQKDYYKKNPDKKIKGKYQPCFDKKALEYKDHKKELISAIHFYWLLNDIRINHSKQRIFEVSVFSHSYSGGPILCNSFRRTSKGKNNENKRDPLDYDMRTTDYISDPAFAFRWSKFYDLKTPPKTNKDILLWQNKLTGEMAYYTSKAFFPDPVYGGTKNELHENLEQYPINLNLLAEGIFTKDATFRIWGCDANALEAVIIESFAESKATSVYPEEFNETAISKLGAEEKAYVVYHQVSISSSWMWKSLKDKGTVSLAKNYSSIDKSDEAAMDAWLTSLFKGVEVYPVLFFLLKGLESYYEYLADKGKKVGSERIKFICDKMYAKLKGGKGTLTLYLSKYKLGLAIFNSGRFGLLPAAIYGVTCHFAPPGAQGLYQEERIYPALKGIKKDYPIHEIAQGHPTKSGIKDYKYNSFNPRTGKSAAYTAPSMNKIIDFYFNELGFSVDGDGYLQVTQLEALNLLGVGAIKFL